MINAIANEKHQHQRAADGRAHDHHICHLHVGHIGGHACHKAGHRKLVDVLERIILYFIEHVLAQIAREAAACGGASAARQCAEGERQPSHHHQHRAVLHNDADGAPGFDLVYQIRRDKRDDALHHHLARDQQRREQQGFLYSRMLLAKTLSIKRCPFLSGSEEPFCDICYDANSSAQKNQPQSLRPPCDRQCGPTRHHAGCRPRLLILSASYAPLLGDEPYLTAFLRFVNRKRGCKKAFSFPHPFVPWQPVVAPCPHAGAGSPPGQHAGRAVHFSAQPCKRVRRAPCGVPPAIPPPAPASAPAPPDTGPLHPPFPAGPLPYDTGHILQNPTGRG